MINQEYIMLIMNCKKYRYKAEYQKQTWLKKLPSFLIYYHVIGNIDLETDYKFDEENKILWIKVEDDYNSLPKKVIRAYQVIHNNFNYKYIFKTDDDQMLTNEKFLVILRDLLSKKDNINYGGFIVDVKKNHLSQYHNIHPELPVNLPIFQTKYCSGRFYFLSNKSVNSLLQNQKYIEKEYFEDYAIGFFLNSKYKINILNLMTNKFFNDIELELELKLGL